MKNGLAFVLVMVALVALTIPAGATAPTIQTLPAVIIGDAGDVSGSGTEATHLLRYLNVFNLADPSIITRPNNPDDPTKLSVWYKVTVDSGSTVLKVSNATALKNADRR